MNKDILESSGRIHRSQILYLYVQILVFSFANTSIFISISKEKDRGVGGCEQRYLGIQWLDTQVAGVRAINPLWQGLNPPL